MNIYYIGFISALIGALIVPWSDTTSRVVKVVLGILATILLGAALSVGVEFK